MKKKLLLLAFFLLLPFLVFTPVLAQEMPKNVVVKKGEVIDRDFFAGAETVTISGTVNGDVFAGGASVTVDGLVNGDLLAGAGTLTLIGEVSDDVRAGGGNVFINGKIGKNLTIGGGSVTITSQAEIDGSVLIFGGNVEIKGPVGRDVRVYGGNVVLGSQIGGDFEGSVEELSLAPEALILGDFKYESPNRAEIASEAAILGETEYNQIEKEKAEGFKKWQRTLSVEPQVPRKAKIWLELSSLIFSFLVGWAYLYFFPKRIQGMSKVLGKSFWKSLGVGVLAMILFGPLLILLTLSLIGIPLVFLLIPTFIFLLYLSRLFFAFFLGEKIIKRLNWNKGSLLALLIGLAIYYLLRQLPGIGQLTLLTYALFGLGAFFLDQKSLRQAKK